MFSGLWSLAKVFLDDKTKKKITLEGSSFQSKLLQEINADQLPLWLGGTCKRELHELDTLPWTPYVKKCKEQKTYFADGVIQSNPFKQPQRMLLQQKEKNKEKKDDERIISFNKITFNDKWD